MKAIKRLIKHFKFINILINPFFHAILVFGIVIYILFPLTQKYQIELFTTGVLSTRENTILFDDLNGDGNSEMITLGINLLGNVCAFVYEQNDKLIDQWNFKGKFLNPNQVGLFTGSHNPSEIKKVYIFTQHHDSIFLNAFDPLGTKKIVFQNLFVCKVGTGGDAFDATAFFHGWFDFHELGYNQALFSLNAGHSQKPRQLFIFDPITFNLHASLSDGTPKHTTELYHRSSDSSLFIITKTPAVSNIPDSSSEVYHDRISWLFIYDKNLKPIIEPIPFDKPRSRLTHFYYTNQKGVDDNLGSYIYHSDYGWQMDFFALDTEFNVVSLDAEYKYNFRELISWRSSIHKARWENNNYCIIFTDKGWIIPISKSNNKVIAQKPIETPIGVFCVAEINNENQLLTIYSLENELWLSTPDLKHPAKIDMPSMYAIPDAIFRFSGVYSMDGKSMPVFNIGKLWFAAQIVKNPLYTFRVIIYLLIFLSIYGFILLIRFSQKYQTQRRQKNEQEMARLQLQVIKNQIDPHFTLNILNNISSVIFTNQKELAFEFYNKFTQLIKRVLTNSGKLFTTLEEDLKFIENYLSLEKLRLNNDLDYEIVVDSEIHVNEINLPRMLLFTFVENAIKHGLCLKTDNRKLYISITKKGELIYATIEDNGIGREKAKELGTTGTGKGLSIVDQIIEIYKKISHQHISYTIEDINYTPENFGTRVIIEMEMDNLVKKDSKE
jgi:hypothetical protein